MRLTLANAFVIILFVGLFVMVAGTVNDPDFWWHLRTGQYIVENHTIPRSDPTFAFTTSGRQWSTQEWLSEVFLWVLYRFAGLPGLSLFFAGLLTSAYALAFIRSPGKPYAAGFATLLAALAALPVFDVRPQIFTLFFLSLLVFLLEKYFEKPARLILIGLPIMMLVWVNLHGGFLLGIVVMAVYLVGKSIELLTGHSADGALRPAFTRQDLFRLAGVLVLSIVLTGINPGGFRIYATPLTTLTSQAMQTYIVEWFSPNFHEAEWVPLALLLLGILGLGLYVRQRHKLTTIGLLTLSAFAALRSVRNVPLFTIIAAPVLSAQLSGVVTLQPSTEKPSRRLGTFLGASLIVIMLLAIALIWLRLDDQSKTTSRSFPAGAAEWIQVHQPPGNLFNSYSWGGYLIWRLYPRYPVFIDGRADLHGDEMMKQYVDIYSTHAGWEQALQDYGVRIVLVEPDSLIAQRLSESGDWSEAYADKTSVLFVRR